MQTRGLTPIAVAQEALVSHRPRYYRRTTCRICRSPDLRVFLDLGPMPLANAFRPAAEVGSSDPERFPLACAYCERCGLVQLPGVVRPDILFTRYSYLSSASEPMVEHFRRQAERIRQEYLTEPSELVCEIGSNDGIFLQHLVGTCRVLGIDPAENIVASAAGKGVRTVTAFFTAATAARLREIVGPATVIFTANCFAHVDGLDDFLAAVLVLLRDDGVFIIENHRFAHMLRSVCFDQIYHEHLCYYTVRPIERVLARFGMRIVDARPIATHGESFQLHCTKVGSPHVEHPRLAQVRREEDALGLDSIDTYTRFAEIVRGRQADLRRLLDAIKADGDRIVAYGAPAKATILLNALGVDRDIVDYAVDSTPLKQGCLIPGTSIPIRPPEALDADTPEYVLVLAWNYAGLILEKERRLRERGTRFIVPMPTPHIV